MIKIMPQLILKLIFLIKITLQDDIIGFYQEFDTQVMSYIWNSCHSTCYTCVKNMDTNNNQNCLSCNPKLGRYLLHNDIQQNCYTLEELQSNNPDNIAYILDTKQTPNKWVACHQNCKTCSDKPSLDQDRTTIIQMNCLECKEGFIKVNTFCYPKDTNDEDNIGFIIEDGSTKHCGDFNDDETGQQLGIIEGNKCIIKPESYYFPQNNKAKKLKKCENRCLACEGIQDNSDDEKSNCLKCKENYVQTSTGCECPNYLGIETQTNNCVNCKYSPEGPYNLEGVCTSTKTSEYQIINTTYNIISNCKRPCLTCDNGRCTKCAPNYFLDKISEQNDTINDDNKICLTYNECKMIGFPDVNFSFCIFCDKTKNEYKIMNQNDCKVVNNPQNEGYYYTIDENHPALGICHERCETCNGRHKGFKFQNCKTCKEPLLYELNTETNNCDEIVREEEEEKIEEEEEIITCDDMLFYIDVDENEENEENINKIKCINGSNLCPDEYQYLDQSNLMCVKNYSYNVIWTDNGLFIKDIEYSDQYNEEEIFEQMMYNNYIHFSNNLSYLEKFWDLLDRKIKNGNITFNYNLRRLSLGFTNFELEGNHYIFNGDSTFHITRTYLQNQLIRTSNSKNNYFAYNYGANYMGDVYSNNFRIKNKYDIYRNKRRVSMIYLSECEKIIKLYHNINSELYILKLDIYKNITNDAINTNKVIYQIYDPRYIPRSPIDLKICKQYPINIITPISYSNEKSSEGYTIYRKLLNIKNAGFEPFIVYSDFYTKICNQYKSLHGTDMNMKDRKVYVYDKIKNFYFCQKNCDYRSTDEIINFINCICIPKNYGDDENNNFNILDEDFTTLDENNEDYYKNVEQNKLLEKINNHKINDYFNFYLVQCIKLLFSYDGFFYNYVSMIIICMYVLYLILIFLYSCIGFDFYINILKEMLFHKFLYREYWRIKKKEGISSEEENNISFEEELKEKDINTIANRKIQNRTNTKNVFERIKKFNPREDNKWIRINKSSVLIDPLKDDQIQPVNEYTYKEKDIYKNKENQIRDYQNNINISSNNYNAPPKRIDNKNNNYYHMEKNNDLINARTIKPITSHNYDDIQTLVKGQQKSDQKIEETDENNKNDINIIDKEINQEKEHEKQNEQNEEIAFGKEKMDQEQEKEKNINNDKNNINLRYNKKTEIHNTSPAIYIYNLILSDYSEDLVIEEKVEKKSNLITKREYSFLNDGEINELDFDNSVFHDKRNFIRIYYSFLKYNCLLIFTFFVYEDFNLNFVKYALFIFYALLYLTFNAAFFNNNSIHNIYINEGDYVLSYHAWKIFLAFILSLIFIKLIKWWITFYRRRSLNMKLLKRYTDAKNEILRMIEQYHFHLKIFFSISCAIFILFWYYISVIFAVFRYSYWYLLLNWGYCALFHLAYSIVLNIIPTILRFVALKKEIKSLYAISRIISYFF